MENFKDTNTLVSKDPPSAPDASDAPQQMKGKHLMIEYDCHHCGKSSYHLKFCAKCRVACYCDEKCQREHWKEHKKECQTKMAKSKRPWFKGGRCVETANFPDDFDEGGTLLMDHSDCPKNGHNQHKEFISIKDFNLSHLSEPLQTQEVIDYIKAEANMTVRVLVKFTSTGRPDSDKQAAYRGKRSSRFASGLFVLDNASSFQIKPCPIKNCQRIRDLGKDHNIFDGDLKIFTNKHVLFDDDEMKSTVVHFFFDDEDTSKRVCEHATRLFYTKPTSDKTFFKVTVHNQELFDRLHKLDLERAEKFRKIPRCVLENWAPHAIVISHPHGGPKRISCGKVIRIRDENVSDETMENAKLAGFLQDKWFSSGTEEDYQGYMKCLQQKPLPVYKMWYNTATCEGSSGGQVLLGGRDVVGVVGPYMSNHVGFDVEAGLNFFKIVQFASDET